MACSKFRWGQRISRGNFSRIFGVRSNLINKPANFDGSIFYKTSRPAEERRGIRFCFLWLFGVLGRSRNRVRAPTLRALDLQSNDHGYCGGIRASGPTYVDIYGLSLDIPANPLQLYAWHFTIQGFKTAVIASPGGN